MTDNLKPIKITGLPAGLALAGNEPMALVQGGRTVQTTPAAFVTLLLSSVGGASSSTAGLMSAGDFNKLSGITAGAVDAAGARTAAVQNSITSGATDTAPSQAAVFTALQGKLNAGARTFAISGDGAGSASADLSAGFTINLTLASTGVTPATYKSVTVDAKGRITGGSNPTTLAGYGIADAIALAGGDMTGPLVLSADPSDPLGAATKQYVDLIAAGFTNKFSVAVATTANITLSGEQTIDGVTTSATRILVKNQSTLSQNGVYVTASGAWARATDMDTWSEVYGAGVFVAGGTAQASTGWACTAVSGGTIDTTAVTYVQQSASLSYSAGTGLGLSGSAFALSGQALALHSATGAGVFTRAAGGAISLTATGVGASGSILTRGDGDARYQAVDATLTALSGLTLAADKLIYATGSGSSATTNFTAAARTFVAATTTAAQRTAIGLGSVEDKSSATIRGEMVAVTNTFSAKQNFSTAFRIHSYIGGSAPAGNKRWGTWIDGNGWFGLSTEADDATLGATALYFKSVAGAPTGAYFGVQTYINDVPMVTTTLGYSLDTGWVSRSLVNRQLLSVQAAELCDTTGATAVEGYIALLLADSRVGEVVFGPGTYKIGSTATIGSTGKKIRVLKGALFQPAANVTLTITSEVEAGNYKIFNVAATGDVTPGASNSAVVGIRAPNAAWWGLNSASNADNAPVFNAQWASMEAAQFSDGRYEPMIPAGRWVCQAGVTWRPLGYLNPKFQFDNTLTDGVALVAGSNAGSFPAGEALLTIGDSVVRTTDFEPPPIALLRKNLSNCTTAVLIQNNISFRPRTWKGLYINGLVNNSDAFQTSVKARGYTTLWHWENFGIFASEVPNAVIWDFESNHGDEVGFAVGDFSFGTGRSVVSTSNGSTHFKLVVNGASLNGINVLTGYHMYGGRAFLLQWATAHNIGDIFISAGAQMDSMGAGLIYAHLSQGQLFNLQMASVYVTQADGADDPSVNAIDIVRTGSSAKAHTLDFSGCQIVGFGGRAALFSGVQGLECSHNRFREIGGGEFADAAIFIDDCTGVAAIGNVYSNPYNADPDIAGRRPLSLIRLQNNNAYATVCGNSGNGIATVISKDDGSAATTTGTKVVANNI